MRSLPSGGDMKKIHCRLKKHTAGLWGIARTYIQVRPQSQWDLPGSSGCIGLLPAGLSFPDLTRWSASRPKPNAGAIVGCADELDAGGAIEFSKCG